MINADMRYYNFLTLSEEDDGYGMATTTEEVAGTIKIAIYLSSQSVQDNINYSGANYVGFTNDKSITDKYIIEYEGKRLKVLYINPKGRYKQVYLGAM
jgi:hypothetical protein